MTSAHKTHRNNSTKTISKSSAWLIGCGGLLVLVAVLLLAPTAWMTVIPDSGKDLEFAVTLTPQNDIQSTPTPIPAIDTATPSNTPTLTGQDTQNNPEFTATATSAATATPPTLSPISTPVFSEAWRLIIPAIELDAPIVGVGLEIQTISGQRMLTWTTPDFFAAGWHTNSAAPGETGNVVLNGHNNIYGEVFRDLDKVTAGDEIIIRADGTDYVYVITERHIIKEQWVSIETREANAQWVQPTEDDRLTLVTCWPYSNNSHRLIVVAVPVITLSPTSIPLHEVE